MPLDLLEFDFDALEALSIAKNEEVGEGSQTGDADSFELLQEIKNYVQDNQYGQDIAALRKQLSLLEESTTLQLKELSRAKDQRSFSVQSTAPALILVDCNNIRFSRQRIAAGRIGGLKWLGELMADVTRHYDNVRKWNDPATIWPCIELYASEQVGYRHHEEEGMLDFLRGIGNGDNVKLIRVFDNEEVTVASKIAEAASSWFAQTPDRYCYLATSDSKTYEYINVAYKPRLHLIASTNPHCYMYIEAAAIKPKPSNERQRNAFAGSLIAANNTGAGRLTDDRSQQLDSAVRPSAAGKQPTAGDLIHTHPSRLAQIQSPQNDSISQLPAIATSVPNNNALIHTHPSRLAQIQQELGNARPPAVADRRSAPSEISNQDSFRSPQSTKFQDLGSADRPISIDDDTDTEVLDVKPNLKELASDGRYRSMSTVDTSRSADSVLRRHLGRPEPSPSTSSASSKYPARMVSLMRPGTSPSTFAELLQLYVVLAGLDERKGSPDFHEAGTVGAQLDRNRYKGQGYPSYKSYVQAAEHAGLVQIKTSASAILVALRA